MKLIPFLLVFCCLSSLNAAINGKAELAPTYVHVDVLQSNNTVKDLDLAAIRGELSWIVWKGYYVKPMILYGTEDDGQILTTGLSIGRCIPLFDGRLTLSPQAGIAYTHLKATLHADFGMGSFKLHEEFSGWAPGIGLEATYRICKGLRVSAGVLYAWSHSKTKIKEFPDLSDTSDSQGPSYSAMIEYDLNDCWSVNLGGAYNESFSKEKDGIRARGLKLGLARWF